MHVNQSRATTWTCAPQLDLCPQFSGARRSMAPSPYDYTTPFKMGTGSSAVPGATGQWDESSCSTAKASEPGVLVF